MFENNKSNNDNNKLWNTEKLRPTACHRIYIYIYFMRNLIRVASAAAADATQINKITVIRLARYDKLLLLLYIQVSYVCVYA